MAAEVDVLFTLLIYFSCSHKVFAQKTVVVASYNIWNVMFQWDVRKQYIAEMINKANPDVLGFQEVRSDLDGKRNQLMELLELTPQYKHFVYHPVNNIAPPLGKHGPPGWEKEGLGIISRHPVILSHIVNLTTDRKSPDRNQRSLLHVQVDIEGDEFDITVVHFSYDKQQQCENAVDVINYIASTGSERSVVLGDFNAYNEFPWPVNGIMKGSFDKQGACYSSRHFDPQDSSHGYGFVDAWVNMNKEITAGYTFSNMPTPGLTSRPDRILVSLTGLKVISVDVVGDGIEYEWKYSLRGKWQRLKMAFAMAKEAAYGARFKYTCYQDCGPHGSCRCGMCVKGGDQRNCELPDCLECDATRYTSFIIILVLHASFATFCMYILLKLFLSRCPLRTRRLHARLFFLCSNRTLAVAMLALLVTMYFITVSSLQDTMEIVNGRIPEEMFPSDHLMLIAKLQFTYR